MMGIVCGRRGRRASRRLFEYCSNLIVGRWNGGLNYGVSVSLVHEHGVA